MLPNPTDNAVGAEHREARTLVITGATGLGKAPPQKEEEEDGGGDGDGARRIPPPSRVGCVDAGGATLYDGRLLHCGGANKSDKLRVLFYVTWRCADHAAGAPQQSQPHSPETKRLAELKRELGRG